MLCPIDQSELVIADRQGIEIDYCPKCRGVWLDRGELDKIIERSSAYLRDDDDDWDDRPRPQTAPPQGYRQDDPSYRPPYRKKKRSFLSEMFDFD